MSRTLLVDTNDFVVEIGDDGVAEIVLGHAGAMPTTDARGHGALAAIWAQLEAQADVRAVLVRSAGKGFCAGGHMDLVNDMLDNESARMRVMREARALVQGMVDCELPIVSAINGAAVGAGAAVALLADVSIAGESAKVIDGHVKIGVAAGDHAALIWPLLCGMAKAKYYLLTNEPLSGIEAERIGLVSRVVPDDRLLETARQVAGQLAAGSPRAIAATKRSLNHWLRAAWPAFEHSLTAEIAGFAGADAREGLAAMAERRAPKFAPRSDIPAAPVGVAPSGAPS
jgi:enoyl-CoA hydratase